VERDFGDTGGDVSRNKSAGIISLMIDGEHMLFPSDAGAPGNRHDRRLALVRAPCAGPRGRHPVEVLDWRFVAVVA
jgi:hypothetical protein